MPSEHSFNLQTVLTDEIRLESFYSEGSKMESQNDLNFNQFLMNGDIDSSPLLSPGTLGSPDISDVADVNDPFTKPTSAQLDFSGNLTPSHSGSNLASQLDNLGSIADRVSNHGNHSKEPSRLMVQIQDEVASISSYSSVSSPEILSPSHSGITSPSTFLNQDASTQLSLIQQAEDLNLHSDGTNLDSDNLWTLLQDAEPTRKVLKTEEQTDTLSMTHGEDNVICTKPFDVGSAISSSQFVFKQFGQFVPGVLTITSTASASTNISGSNGAAITSAAITASSVPVSIRQPPRRLKTPSLALAFSAKQNGCELKILAQPEEQHRARYMTEGSRGSVKDTSGQAHPTVQLLGYKQKATLQVFVGSETGRVKPHGFYQACKVCGKNSTPCTERDIDGTTVIEMDFDPDEDMKLSIDCVGILKLRNADVEQRIGLAKSKKRSTKARLVFRVCLPKADGSTLTLQVASSQILCTQPIGQPEICKKSLKEAPVTGGDDLFIIGKNFMKGTKVLFQEMANENSKEVVWEKAAEIDNEFFQQTHLICQVPEYDKCQTFVPVLVSVVVECSGRLSDPHSFTYTPVPIAGGANTPCPSGTHTPVEAKMEIKREIIHIPMETEIEQPVSASLSFVSPVALELNKLIQQGQQDGIFRIPAGVGLPASSTPDSSAKDTPLMSMSTSSSGMTAELRTISSMDISSATEVSLPTSSISANSPMLASLLVKDPDTIHSPTTLGPQSPAQGEQSPLGLQTPPDVSQFHQHDTLASAETQLSQLLQQSQQTSVVPQTPSEISQFLQDSPLGQLDSLSTETPERSTSPQPPTETSQFLQESSPTSTNVSQFLQQTSLSNQQASAGTFQTTPGISQFLQQISSTQTSAEVTFVQTQPQFVQVSMIGLPTQTMSSQSSDISQFLQQMLLSQQNSNTSQQTAAVSGVPQFLQSSPAMNTLTFTVLSSSSPIMVQQTAPTMVQQRPTATMMQEQRSPVMQQQPDSSMMQQQALSPMQQHDSPMMQQQVPSSMMQQQASSPVMQLQVPSPVMQQVASPITRQSPETVQQASSETQSMSNMEQQASSKQSIEHASQTIDKLVSECQKEDSLQPNNGFMTSDRNSLPSISLDDVNDILKNDMS